MLTEEERAFIRPYLEMTTNGCKCWIAGVVLGALLCVLSVVLYFLVRPQVHSYCFLFFVAGLVIVDVSLDYRRRKKLARIIKKYAEAIEEREARSIEGR